MRDSENLPVKLITKSSKEEAAKHQTALPVSSPELKQEVSLDTPVSAPIIPQVEIILEPSEKNSEVFRQPVAILVEEGRELLVPETSEDFEQMEKRDEEQIKAELVGKFLDEFVYRFTSGGRDIVGLSWAGVKEAARRLGHIKVIDLKIEDKGDNWIAQCKAIDTLSRFELYGTAMQPKKQKTRDGEQIDNFALPKVVSKAQRNAIRSVIPENIIKAMILKYAEEVKQKAKTPRQP